MKERIGMRMQILSYTIQLVIPTACTKFQNPTCSISREISDNFFGEKEKKKDK